ncbi:ParE toxin of type II toxin-antitoxin system, parDE [uncultured archaeon]|nr:ParE toxin of type II toxin-antitoxin system, parDE [uncultured archaeon]
MQYQVQWTQEFQNQYHKLTRKNKSLQERLDKKIAQIIKTPELGDPKRHDLKYTRGAHVDPFVIVYLILGRTILFLYVAHHKRVYEEAPRVLDNVKHEFPALWALLPKK